MKIILTIVITLFLSSCSMFKKEGVEVKIINESGGTISDIELTTTEKVEVVGITSLEENKNTSRFLSTQKNKIDGTYSLTFTRSNGKKETKYFGYYSNGNSSNEFLNVFIKKDTIIANFDFIGNH